MVQNFIMDPLWNFKHCSSSFKWQIICQSSGKIAQLQGSFNTRLQVEGLLTFEERLEGQPMNLDKSARKPKVLREGK